MSKLSVNLSYPYSQEYDYETFLIRLNLDEEREKDILRGNGFIVGDPKGIKKDLKDPNSIFSSKYGQTLKDLNPFSDRYKCECGHTTSRIYNDTTCRICGSKVKYVDDNFEYFGWLVLQDKYYIIHPNLYKSIEFLIGKDLNLILDIKSKSDEDGHIIESDIDKDCPYKGIGMIEFKNKFDEIMLYYLHQKPNKEEYYIDIMQNRDRVFTQSIPVFTTYLRPFNADGKSLYFEKTNSLYSMMAKLVSNINITKLKINRKLKPKNNLLYDLQMLYNKLYQNELIPLLSGKKGTIRTLFGGRCNFSSRDVITPDPSLRIDQITLPYECLVELLQQSIINILHKSYNMNYSDAYNYLYQANIEPNDTIVKIINTIIKSYDRGIPIIINRNPTIAYGGILQMFCCGINFNYTMGTPLQILPLLAADFDGDVLNVLYIINKDLFERSYAIFNPRNSMHISRNDGKFNNDVNFARDTIINSNTLIRLSRPNYSEKNLKNIFRIRNKYIN